MFDTAVDDGHRRGWWKTLYIIGALWKMVDAAVDDHFYQAGLSGVFLDTVLPLVLQS